MITLSFKKKKPILLEVTCNLEMEEVGESKNLFFRFNEVNDRISSHDVSGEEYYLEMDEVEELHFLSTNLFSL